MKQEYTITVYTENQIGLINKLAIIFTRRKINIESLNTSPSEVEGIHRFTIVINETEDVVTVPGFVPNARSSKLSLRPQPFTAIPYYTWANRGQSPMQVWLPTKVK